MKTILREYLHALNILEEDRDVYVDGIDGIAVCTPICLTAEGEKEFADIMDMVVDGDTIIGTEADYNAMYDFEDDEREDGGRIYKAWDFLRALAGYCSFDEYERWVVDGDKI